MLIVNVHGFKFWKFLIFSPFGSQKKAIYYLNIHQILIMRLSYIYIYIYMKASLLRFDEYSDNKLLSFVIQTGKRSGISKI